MYSNTVYASRFHVNKPEYLWWKYTTTDPNGDVMIVPSDTFNDPTSGTITPNYFKWRNDLWACGKPIRYPNKRNLRCNTQFSVVIDKDDNEYRYDYLTARKEIYMKEYIRLVKQTKEYKELLDKLQNKENIMLRI